MARIPDATDRRLHRLVDHDQFRDDAQYHAMLCAFRRWLEMTRMALEDEGASEVTIERVLNRLVYGAPYDGATVDEKIREVESLLHGPRVGPLLPADAALRLANGEPL